ncbi:MAG: ribbon-helix-helix domain-containing protein [Acidobacteriota bacterium]|jgi:hypothetical protein
MRSVVHVDSDVLTEAQQLADQRGVSVEEIIEQAVSELIKRSAPRDLPTFRGTGVRPGIDLDRTCELLDVMDGDDPR